MPAGRPITYKEPRKDILLKIDMLEYNKLREKAEKNKISITEFINALVMQGDEERALMLAKAFNDLMKEVSRWKDTNKSCEERLNKILGRNLSESIYTDLEPDENTRHAFASIKEKFLKVKKDNTILSSEQIDIWINLTYEKAEEMMFDKGKAIKNKDIVKRMIKKLIFDALKK
jgi:gas vesicle protein